MKKNCFSIFSPWRKYKILLYLNLTVILLLSQTFCLSAAGLAEGKSGLIDNPQQITVRGTVTDASTKEALPGVNVIISGTTIGAITDASGNFTLEAPNASVKIQFSFIGYIMQEVALAGKTTLNVALESDVAQLSEVVVVGYGVQKKVNLTGAVSSMGSAKLTAVTSPDLSNSMVGKLPGLRVITAGSEPGLYDNRIDIRGWGTMLVVIDGVPRDDFQRIDPSQIESVSILKDASASVYGVKAANGVMLITTKKGEAGKGEITVNSSFGFQKMTDFPRAITNSIDNLILKNEAALVAGNPMPFPDYKLYTGQDPNYPSVDWWGLTVQETMPMNKSDISFSGGTERVTYFVSVGNLHETGIYKTNSLNYDRYNFRSNVTANIVKGLNANVIIGGFLDTRNDPFGSSSFEFMKQVWMQPPYEPIYANNTAPYYYDGQADRNPLTSINSDLTGYRRYRTKSLQTTMSMTYDIPFVKGLQVKGLFAYDLKYGIQSLFRKAYNEYKYNTTSGLYIPTGLNSPTRLQKYFDEWIYTQSQLSLNYKNTFSEGTHSVEGLLLLDRRDGNGDGFMAQRYYSIATIEQLNAGLTDNQATSGVMKVLDANLALVGRLNYGFKSKYLAEFSFRYDGSSLFPADSRWGFFPAVSLGWRISEESFIKDNLSFISNLKLRVSHGVMGDDSGAGGFQFIPGYTYPAGTFKANGSNFPSNYVFDGKTLTSGAVSKGLANPNITWYTATTSNVGIDATLWKGLLDLTFDVFQRKREGLLTTRAETLPSEFGASFPKENLNSDLSRGFELSVGHSKMFSDFSYSVRTNISYAQTRWIHNEQAPATNTYLNWRTINEDRNVNILWGYGYVGQFQTQEEINTAPVQNANGHAALFPGDIKYQDWNEDGMINELDMYPITRNEDPEIYYGLDMTGGWKGLSLNMVLQGATNYSQTATEQLQGPLPWGRNSLTIFLDRWHHQDPLDFSTPWIPGKYPITRDGFGFGPNKLTSPFWSVDVAYLRLKSIELSYTLPQSLVKMIKAKQLRIYTNAYNVVTWKKKGVMFDPEHRGSGTSAENGYKYPVMASYNFGLNLTF